MARTREVAGGGRAVEVEPERLLGWFARFAERHGGLLAVDGTGRHVRFRAADGASAEVVVPFGGLPVDSRRRPDRLAAVLDALHAHLAVPRRIGIVLVRLGGYSIGVAVGGVVETSTTGARLVHGRNRKGGSSSGRFARRRDNQARVALDAAADAVARFLLPVADTLDAIVLGGDAAALDDLRADRRLAALLARAEPRVLDVPEPRRAVLDEAARRALAVEIVVREPATRDRRERTPWSAHAVVTFGGRRIAGQPSPPVASSPPSTRTVSPVIHDAASDTRNPTSAATSSGVPSRPSGYAAATFSSPAGVERRREPRPDDGGRDGVDPDPRPELPRQLLGQPDERGLGRPVARRCRASSAAPPPTPC